MSDLTTPDPSDFVDPVDPVDTVDTADPIDPVDTPDAGPTELPPDPPYGPGTILDGDGNDTTFLDRPSELAPDPTSTPDDLPEAPPLPEPSSPQVGVLPPPLPAGFEDGAISPDAGEAPPLPAGVDPNATGNPIGIPIGADTGADDATVEAAPPLPAGVDPNATGNPIGIPIGADTTGADDATVEAAPPLPAGVDPNATGNPIGIPIDADTGGDAGTDDLPDAGAFVPPHERADLDTGMAPPAPGATDADPDGGPDPDGPGDDDVPEGGGIVLPGPTDDLPDPGIPTVFDGGGDDGGGDDGGGEDTTGGGDIVLPGPDPVTSLGGSAEEFVEVLTGQQLSADQVARLSQLGTENPDVPGMRILSPEDISEFMESEGLVEGASGPEVGGDTIGALITAGRDVIIMGDGAEAVFPTKVVGFDGNGVDLQDRHGGKYHIPRTDFDNSWSKTGNRFVSLPKFDELAALADPLAPLDPIAATPTPEPVDDGGLPGGVVAASAIGLPLVLGGGYLAARKIKH